MDLSLTDKVVFITGGGSGMGQKFALDFAAEGARVVVNDVNAQGIEQTLDLVKQAGGRAMAAHCDITSLDAVKEAVQQVEAEHGRLDILVNNAAVLIQHVLFLDTRPADCEREINVILKGTMNCARAALNWSLCASLP